MNSDQIAVILKSFDAPDEVRVMQKGKFELVHLGGITIGRARMTRMEMERARRPECRRDALSREHVGLVSREPQQSRSTMVE